MPKESVKLIANNKKARFDYFILESFECGIELFGTEVKSMRLGQCSIKESWVEIKGGEVFINGMHINPYEKGNIFNKDPLRTRKLLLHKAEIRKLAGAASQDGSEQGLEEILPSVHHCLLSFVDNGGIGISGGIEGYFFLRNADGKVPHRNGDSFLLYACAERKVRAF